MNSDNNPAKVNVLGVNVSAVSPKKAVTRSLELMRSKEIYSVFFLTSMSSAYSEENPWAIEVIDQCELVLAGDKNTETAVFSTPNWIETSKKIDEYTDEYFKFFFYRLNKENRCVYTVVEEEEELERFKAYFKDYYGGIYADGIVFKDYDNAVNEINAVTPDVLFLCLPVENQLNFLKSYVSMMNTKLVIAIYSMEPHIRKATNEAPSFFKILHLEKLYHWIKK